MPITWPFPPPLAAGAMVASRIMDDLAELRRWEDGGIVTADIVDDSVRAQHIFRPDTFGFPAQVAHFGTGRIVGWRGDSADSIDIRAQTRRIDMSASMATRASAIPMTSRFGMTVDFWDSAAFVRVGCNFSAYVGYLYNTVLVTQYCGTFHLKYRERTSGIESICPTSYRTLNIGSGDIGQQYGRYALQGIIQMTAGKWDVWPEWEPEVQSSDSALVGSVAIGMGNFTLASHRVGA